MDRWTAPSIFIHRIPHVSHVKICLSASGMCQRVNEKVSGRKKKGLFEHPNMSSRSKIVTEGDKLKDVSSLGVKMADRWMAAGRKSLCTRFTNLLALLNRRIHDSSLFPSVLTVLAIFYPFMDL